MSSKSLVICDREEKFTAAFAAFLMKKKELAFQVQICNGLSQMSAIRQKDPVDVLVINGNYPAQERAKIPASHVFVLAESENVTENPGEVVIYKYQSAEIILAEIIRRCTEENDSEGIFFCTGKTKECRIIGIFSPIHRCGKTSYGLKLGKELAESYNVLYLNMELYGGIGGYFPEQGHTLEDALYYSRQESQNLGVMIAALVNHMGHLDYLLPARVSENLKMVALEEWLNLIRQIVAQSIYDVLLLDVDEGLRDVYGILRVCTEIQVPIVAGEVAKAKIMQMEEELRLLGYEDVMRKMQKKELKL